MTTQKTLEKAEKLFRGGKWKQAEACFRAVLDRDPCNPEALNNLGVLAFQQGNLPKSEHLFFQALEANPYYRDALFNLAEILNPAGRLAEAVPALRAYCEKFPDDEETAGLLAGAETLPLVSVHMIVWNGEKYIAEAVESVLNQTYPNVELVIVDDGSTDRTRGIVEGFKSDKIRYAWKEHSGIVSTRNVARRLCRGDYIAFLDADDLYEPQALEIEVRTLLENPDVDVVYANLKIIDDTGKETGEIWRYRDYEPGELIAALFRRGQNVTSSGSMMFTRKISDQVGAFDERFIISFDSDYIARLARCGRFRHIDLPLYRYRRHGSSITCDKRNMKERARSTVMMLNRMLTLFTREELCPEIPFHELSAEKAAAAFHLHAAGVFWSHCRAFFETGHYGELLRETEHHVRKCLEINPDHRGAGRLMEEIGILSGMEKAETAGLSPGKKRAARKRHPLRILYLSDSRSPHTKRYVRFFRDRGHDVHLFDTCRDEKDLDGITLHTPAIPCPDIPPSKTADPFLHTVWGLNRVLAEIKPQILHGHYLRGWCWWGAFTGFQPFVTTAWGSDVFLEPNRPFIRRLTAFCLEESPLVTADSMDLLEATAGLRGFRDGLLYIPFGIDTEFFRPGCDVSGLARKLNINGSRVVLSPRQFKPEANIHVLVQAIPKILRKAPETVFILKTYLTGDPALRRYEENLEKLVRAHQVEDHVHFVKDLPFEEMPLLYNLADVMVSIRDTDGSSCSMLEAMACRTPVVVSDIESMREWVKDGGNGRVVDAHDPDAVAEAVLSILSDRDAGRRFSDASYDLVRKRADYRTNWAAVEESYYELLDHPHDRVNRPENGTPAGNLVREGWRLVGQDRFDKGHKALSMALGIPDLPMRHHLKALLGLGKIAWARGEWEKMESHYINALKLLHTFELDKPLTIRG